MRERRVVRFIPRRAAAPSAPPTRPLHAVSARMIWSRCFPLYSLAALLLSFGEFALSPATGLTSCRSVCTNASVLVFRSSASGASSDLPLVRITARSMKFSSSRILPGQSQVLSPFITAVGIASIGFCISLANFWTVAGSTRGRDIFAAMMHQRNRRAALALQQTEIAEQCRNLAGGVFVDGMQADQGVEDEKNGAVKQESGLKPLLVGDAVQPQRIRGDDAKVQASQRKAGCCASDSRRNRSVAWESSAA